MRILNKLKRIPSSKATQYETWLCENKAAASNSAMAKLALVIDTARATWEADHKRGFVHDPHTMVHYITDALLSSPALLVDAIREDGWEIELKDDKIILVRYHDRD